MNYQLTQKIKLINRCMMARVEGANTFCPQVQGYSMHRDVRRFTVLAIACGLSLGAIPMSPATGRQVAPRRWSPAPVKVVSQGDSCTLSRNGKPYTIHGVGGSENLSLLASFGGSSVRTWDAKNLEPLLNECHKLGLSVSVDLWLGHERHGFDYNHADQVADQFESARATILRYKDRPAVPMWGIGKSGALARVSGCPDRKRPFSNQNWLCFCCRRARPTS